MNTCRLIFWREWLLFTRNRMQLLILIVFVIAALYAIYYGNAEITRQQQNITYIKQQNAREQATLVGGLQADTTTTEGLTAWEKAAYPSKVRFFLNYYAINDPSPFAKLSIGQRDVNFYYLALNAQNLYLQLFRSEITNPRKLLAGNFDLSFVVIYLLPLLIIAFTYNVLSDEKERGTLPIIQVQPVSIRTVIGYKHLFWFGITTFLLVLLSVIAFGWSGITMAQCSSIGWWFLITISYASTWFALTLLINAFNKNSAFNAIASLGLWLLFLVVIPAIINLAVTREKLVDPTKLTEFIRRQQGSGETKQEKLALLNHFYERYPQYRNTDTSAGNAFLDFQAYSAFVTLQDDEARPAVNAYYQKIWARYQQTANCNLINPAVNAQNLLNIVGHSGLEEVFAFRIAIEKFHRQLCHFCFEPLFAGRMMRSADFKKIPAFTPLPPASATGTLLKGLGWLWLLTVIISAMIYFRMRYCL
jgi:ABC-2 type transport system permease protein